MLREAADGGTGTACEVHHTRPPTPPHGSANAAPHMAMHATVVKLVETASFTTVTCRPSDQGLLQVDREVLGLEELVDAGEPALPA